LRTISHNDKIEVPRPYPQKFLDALFGTEASEYNVIWMGSVRTAKTLPLSICDVVRE
jgi:hypothetical protein